MEDQDSDAEEDLDEHSKCYWVCKRKFGIEKIKDISFLKCMDHDLPNNI